MSTETDTHTIAWDGFQFLAPKDWNLSNYNLRRDVSDLALQDDAALRLEMEWFRPARALDPRRIGAQAARTERELKAAGAAIRECSELPPGWQASIFSFDDGRHLVSALWYSPADSFCGYFKLHFRHCGRREPERALRRLVESFVLQSGRRRLWSVYDMAFTLDRDWRLTGTSFQAGCKRMDFEWRFRRLYVWQVSLADLALKGRAPETWAAEWLNNFRAIRGPVFYSDGSGKVAARRNRRRYPLGHIEEIARGCFRYRTNVRYDVANNRLLIWVFNHRNDADPESVALPEWATAS